MRLENPRTGERMEFEDRQGPELFRAEYWMPAQGSLRGTHLHPRQEQRITVLSGEMRCRVAGKDLAVREGETVTIPDGVPHAQWNESGREVHVVEEVRPALRMQAFFEAMFRLGAEGRLERSRPSGLLWTAVLFESFRDEFRILTPLPARMLFPVMAWVGGRLGYRVP